MVREGRFGNFDRILLVFRLLLPARRQRLDVGHHRPAVALGQELERRHVVVGHQAAGDGLEQVRIGGEGAARRGADLEHRLGEVPRLARQLVLRRILVGQLPYGAVPVAVDPVAADAQAPIDPIAVRKEGRIRRHRLADRLDVPGGGRQVEHRIGVGRQVRPPLHHPAHRHDQPEHEHHHRQRNRPVQRRSPSCSNATTARTGGRRRSPPIAAPATTAPAPVRGSAAPLNGGRGPGPSPCWTSTCRLPAPSWPRCSHR